jgi:glutamate-1-semialdehyde 2,1-aminomutase
MPSTPQGPDLATAIEAVTARYAAANPASAAQLKEAARWLPGGNTRVALHYDPFPLGIARAEHGTVHDLDGHAYLDFMNDLTAGFYGHSNPVIIAALHAALARGMSFGAPSVHEARLAEAICARFPAIERVRFCNSGTEANLIAMQLARAITGRSTVLAFSGGYHGSLASFLPDLAALNVDGERTRLARFNDVASARDAAMQIGADLAAIIVEPMMGSAGGILADRAFLATLRALATESGAFLIFDEVQTARLAYGGLQEVFSVRPDITTLGKFVGGGLSFGAFGGHADIIDRLDPSRSNRIGHGGTFNNNVLTMVAGHAGLSSVATRLALDEVNRRADRLRARLQETARSHGIPLQTGGYGSIISLHFQPRAPAHPGEVASSPQWRKLLHLEMLLRGIYVSRRGTINLSLATSDADCQAFAQALGDILERHAHALVDS